MIDLHSFDLLWGYIVRCPDNHSRCSDALCLEGAGYPEIHDVSMPCFVDHEVLRFQIPVHNSQLVGFGQPFAGLLGNIHGFSDTQMPHSPQGAFEIFARYVFHGDVRSVFVLTEVIHTADVFVCDFSGEFELVPETLDHLLIRGDLGLQQF